jgi:TonB family protein
MQNRYSSLRNIASTFIISATVLVACNFDSDKDYKSEEKDGAVDTTQRGSSYYQQHHESNPPRDAQKDSTGGTNATPAGSNSPRNANDSSVKKDSSAKTKQTSSLSPRKGKATTTAGWASSSTDKKIDSEGIYVNTDVLPEYPGGKKAIQKYIEENIQYPAQAVEEEVEGTVNITFAVDENGNVYKATTIGSKIGYGLEQEALRVVNKMPKWKPGKVNGKNVKTRLSLPVVFLIS